MLLNSAALSENIAQEIGKWLAMRNAMAMLLGITFNCKSRLNDCQLLPSMTVMSK